MNDMLGLTGEPWVRRISDPEAVKPEEWDEDAPAEIVDSDATQPEGWLADEPDEVDDAGVLLFPSHLILIFTATKPQLHNSRTERTVGAKL